MMVFAGAKCLHFIRLDLEYCNLMLPVKWLLVTFPRYGCVKLTQILSGQWVFLKRFLLQIKANNFPLHSTLWSKKLFILPWTSAGTVMSVLYRAVAVHRFAYGVCVCGGPIKTQGLVSRRTAADWGSHRPLRGFQRLALSLPSIYST